MVRCDRTLIENIWNRTRKSSTKGSHRKSDFFRDSFLSVVFKNISFLLMYAFNWPKQFCFIYLQMFLRTSRLCNGWYWDMQGFVV